MDLTKNYKLKKPEVTDVVHIEDLNDNADTLDSKLKEIETQVSATKKSVSDGKSEIAAAITLKKVSTAADATFSQMAANIKSIIAGSGNATAADVLAGKTFTNSTGIEQVGTIASKGAATITPGKTNQTIAGGQYLSGVQTIASLGGNAQASQVLSGYTFSSDSVGRAVAGTLAIQSILSFSAAVYSSTAITFTWKNPAKGPFSGVIIVGKTGSYPTSISDGTRYYKGYGSNAAVSGTSTVTVSNLTSGTTYYFRAFSYAVKDNAEWIHGTFYSATAATAKGQVSLTSSGTWMVPAGVRNIDVFCVGGGSSGRPGWYANSGDNGNNQRSGGGGAGGYTATVKDIAVTPGQQISYIIGAGGVAGYNTNISGEGSNSGGTTSFGSYVSAGGGKNTGYLSSSQPDNNISLTNYNHCEYGCNGGTGGGSAFQRGTSTSSSGNYKGPGGAGGSNGGNGTGMTGNNSSSWETTNKIGYGQGTTTRAFKESSNTLYAGGGGGGARGDYSAGIGGAGGGGNGSNDSATAAPSGGKNTGGGGGGGSFGWSNGATGNRPGAGGSGVILVRWGY